MFLVLSSSCLSPIYWSLVLSWEWRCSWSSADRRCSNYIWEINNLSAPQRCVLYERFDGTSLFVSGIHRKSVVSWDKLTIMQSFHFLLLAWINGWTSIWIARELWRLCDFTRGHIGCWCSTWWCHQMETFSALLVLCAGTSPFTCEFPHKDQWRGDLMFSSICNQTYGWVNNRDAGDLRRHRVHYDVTVLKTESKYYSQLISLDQYPCASVLVSSLFVCAISQNAPTFVID